MSKKVERQPYPKGILTEPFQPVFVPGTHQLTAQCRKQESAILRALAEELGVSHVAGTPRYWEAMAHALIRRHVPAFQQRQAGRPNTRADVHGFWLRMWLQAQREHPRAGIFEHIARKLNKAPKPADKYCVSYGPDLKTPITASQVKGAIRRAREWDEEQRFANQAARARQKSVR
jgi:hypothetical protein